jgi:hypothetical protein
VLSPDDVRREEGWPASRGPAAGSISRRRWRAASRRRWHAGPVAPPRQPTTAARSRGSARGGRARATTPIPTPLNSPASGRPRAALHTPSARPRHGARQRRLDHRARQRRHHGVVGLTQHAINHGDKGWLAPLLVAASGDALESRRAHHAARRLSFVAVVHNRRVGVAQECSQEPRGEIGHLGRHCSRVITERFEIGERDLKW